MTCFLGIDLGTSVAKVLVVDEHQAVRASAEAPLTTSHPAPLASEQDCESWWQAVAAALDRIAAEAPAAMADVAAIGLSGQMHATVLLDEADRPIRPAMLWNDGRTGAECAEIEERVGLDQLIALTGNRALTGFTAPKLRWLARHEPDVYARIDRIMLPKDYVRLRLCGEHATDVADASGTLLFDVAHRKWSEEVCSALGVPAEWLPRALESAEVSGETSDGIPVAAGAGDQAAGALGVGVTHAGEPLSVEHGFPVRMVVPGLYGYVSACKWIVDIEATTFAKFDAYWVDQGWVQQAPIVVSSRIDTPKSGAC